MIKKWAKVLTLSAALACTMPMAFAENWVFMEKDLYNIDTYVDLDSLQRYDTEATFWNKDVNPKTGEEFKYRVRLYRNSNRVILLEGRFYESSTGNVIELRKPIEGRLIPSSRAQSFIWDAKLPVPQETSNKATVSSKAE